MPPASESLGDRIRAFARPWELASFIWVPAIAIAYAFWWELRTTKRLQDFGIFRVAAKAVLHGHSPFPPPTPAGVAHFDKFVYPPSTALAFAPFAELPLIVGQVLMLVLGVAAIFVALRILGVRDWRCYGVVLMTSPSVNTFTLGAVTSFLLVGVAAAWRYRDRPATSGVLVGLTALGKLFLWPVGLWLLATRRFRAAAVAVASGVVVLLAGWAVIDFAGLRTYPRLLRELSKAEQGTSYSPVALFHLSGRPATLLTAVLLVLLVVGVVLAARGPDGDRRALCVAVVGSLLVTPIVWLHYLLLLYVPIALYRPRLSGLWLAPLVLWLTPSTHSHGVVWHIALAIAVVLLVLGRTVGEARTRRLVARRGFARGREGSARTLST